MVWPIMVGANAGCHVRTAAEAKSTRCPTVNFDVPITVLVQFRRPRFCVQGMVNCPPFGASAMNIRGLGTDRLHLKLRNMSDEDLWWFFLNHREECSREFWEELESRCWQFIQKQSILEQLARYFQPQ